MAAGENNVHTHTQKKNTREKKNDRKTKNEGPEGLEQDGGNQGDPGVSFSFCYSRNGERKEGREDLTRERERERGGWQNEKNYLENKMKEGKF